MPLTVTGCWMVFEFASTKGMTTNTAEKVRVVSPRKINRICVFMRIFGPGQMPGFNPRTNESAFKGFRNSQPCFEPALDSRGNIGREYDRRSISHEGRDPGSLGSQFFPLKTLDFS